MRAPLDDARLLRRAASASVAIAVLLILSKALAWWITGSVAVLASLADSLMDALASGVNLLAVRWALQPADAEHRFGHGKAEALSALLQAGFVAGSALFLALHAAERLATPRALTDPAVALAVMAFSIALTLALLAYQRRVIRRTGSTAIRADALHYASDLLANLGVVAGLLLATLGWPLADPLIALLIAAWIARSALGIARAALDQLMDRELPAEEQQAILAIARAQPGVLGVHGLRTRRSGPARFVQLHLELDPDLPLRKAHAIADAVERAIAARIPGAEVIVHQDPAGPEG